MKVVIPGHRLGLFRWIVVSVFTLAAMLATLYLWVQMGGEVPGITGGYEVSVPMSDVRNLVPDGDVRMAGVPVGSVLSIDAREGEERAEVVLRLDDRVAPLHQGVTFTLRPKTLIEEMFVDVVDGDGEELPPGTRVAAEAVQPTVRLDDVLNSLDDATLASLQDVVAGLDTAVAGRDDDLSRVLAGLGDLGREGADALDILASQTEQLESLVRNGEVLLETLDAGEGDIAELVTDARDVSDAAAGRRSALEATMRQLPGVVTVAQTASSSLRQLTGDLAPVAEQLRVAAPGLDAALVELEPTTADLRGLLPDLDEALVAAPAPLERVPGTASDVDDLLPTATTAFGDVTPVLSYLRPYGRDLSAFFAGFGNVFSVDANGGYLRAYVVVNEQTAKAFPFSTEVIDLLERSNAYPEPGGSRTPGPFEGSYERVREEPVEP